MGCLSFFAFVFAALAWEATGSFLLGLFVLVLGLGLTAPRRRRR